MPTFYIEAGTGRQVSDLSTVDPNKTYYQSGTGTQLPGSALASQTQAMQNQPPTPAAPTLTPPTLQNTSDQYLQAYLDALKPSAQEGQYQGQLDALTGQEANINASKNLGIQAVNEQPIATPFLTGQAATITNRAATQMGALSAQAVPLQTQLARAQALRQSALDVNKERLAYAQSRDSVANTFAQNQYNQQVSAQKNTFQEVNPGNTLYNTALGKAVYTAPTTANQNATSGTPSTGGTTTTVAGLNSGKTFVSGNLQFSPEQYQQYRSTMLSTTIKDAAGNPNRGSDGYVNPAVYLQGLQTWLGQGGLKSDYLQLFPIKDYINPANTWPQIIALGGGTKPKTTTITTSTSGTLY